MNAQAAVLYWDGTTGRWTDLTSWSTVSGATTPDPLTIPGSGDNAIFNITTTNGDETVYLDGNQSISNMTFNNTGVTTILGGNSSTQAINSLTVGGTFVTGTGGVVFGSASGADSVNVSVAGTFSPSSGSITLNGTSSLTVGGNSAINMGNIAGSGVVMNLNNSSSFVAAGTGAKAIGSLGSATLNISGNSTVSFGAAVVTIGRDAAAGVVNMSGGSFTNLGEMRVGGTDISGAQTGGGGTFTLTGGNVRVAGLTVSRGNNFEYVNTGVVNINGGTFTSTEDVILSFAGNNNLGKLAINGGTFNAGTTATKWMMVGFWDTTKGEVDITSGNLNLNSGTSIKFNRGNSTGGNVINQTGGLVTFYSDFATTVGGGGNLDLMYAGAAASVTAYNLDGGTLTVPQIISSTNNGSRAFNFNGGVLRPTAATTNFITLGTGTAVANVRNNGAIIDTNGNNVAFSQPLQHSNILGDAAIDGGLTKRGAGSLTLSVSNSYTGPTNITGGKLVLSGSADINATSAVTINGGGLSQIGTTAVTPTVNLVNGTLDGNGTINNVLVSDNAANVISNAAGGTLTLNTLAFNGAAAFNLNVPANTPEIITTTLSTNAAGVVTINASNSLWTAGTYNLIQYSGSIGGAGFAKFAKGAISGLSGRQSATLTNPTGFIALTIAGDNPVWTGAQNGNWTTTAVGGAQNWKLITGGTGTEFLSGDSVLFDDTAGSNGGTTTVNISNASVSTTSVTFNNNSFSYTIGSTGGFGISAGSVVLNGSGLVAMSANSTYAGGTTVSNGTLGINSASAIGTGTLTMNGGAIDNTSGVPVTLSTNNAQAWNGNFTFAGTGDLNLGTGAVTLSANRTVTVNNTGVLTVGGAISGTGMSLAKAGTGKLRLTGTNLYTGGTIVDNGTLEIAGGTTGQTSADVQISPNIGDSGTLVISSGGTLLANRVIIGGNSTNAGDPSSGTLIQTGGTITSQQWFTVGSGVNAGNVGLAGTYTISGGTLNVIGQQMEVANFGACSGTVNMSGGSINIMNNNFISLGANDNAADGTFTQSGGTVTFYSDNGTTVGGTGILYLGRAGTLASTYTYNLDGGTLTVPQVLRNTANTATATFNFNGGTLKAARATTNLMLGLTSINVKNGGATIDDGGFAVTLTQDLSASGSGGLTKQGAGTLTYTGNGGYSGPTVVSAGKLVLSGTGHVNGSSGIAVNGGGKLLVTTTTAITSAIAVNNGSLDGTATLSSVTVASNVANSVSNGNGAAVPININTLTLNGNATLNILVNSTSAGILTSSLIANGAAGSVVVNAGNASWTSGTTYQLVSYSGSILGTGFSAFTRGTITGLTPRQTASLVDIPGSAIGLSITGGNIPVWTGALSGSWTTATLAAPKNWKLQTGGATTDYINGDDVLFDDSATGTTTVDISDAAVSPTGVTFNNSSKNYVITSSGGFGIGSGFVVKNGTGSVTLTTNNTYSGGTTLTAGTLIVNHTSAIGTGALTIAGGSLDTTGASDLALATNNNLNINGDFTFVGTKSLSLGSGTVTLGGAAGSRAINVVAGTLGIGSIPVATTGIGLTKNGAGTLLIGGSANSRIDGTLAINNGTVQVAQDTFVTGLTGSGTLEATAGKWFFITNAVDNTFSGIFRDGSGLLGLNKSGSGVLTMSNTGNFFSLATTVNAGTLTFSGSGVSISQTNNIGTTAGVNAKMIVTSGTSWGSSYNPGQIWQSSINVSTNATSAGAIVNQGGTIVSNKQFAVGGTGYGAFSQTAGTTTIGGFVALGGNANGGVINLSGGTINQTTAPMTVGFVNASGLGVLNVSGTGILNVTGANGNGIWIGELGTGILNVSGSGQVNITSAGSLTGGGGLVLGRSNASAVATVNLNGGVLTTPFVTKGTGAGAVNFNGGTLKANASTATFMEGLNSATLYAGGGTIDDGGNTITIAQPLVGATGNGVTASGLTFSGGGYVDTPLVQVSGDGTGATAVANIDSVGNLTGVTITSPGTGYTNASFTLVGGGNGNTGSIGGTAVIAPNVSGGLTKSGTGTTTLTGAANYTGVTQITAGKLAFAGAVTHNVGAIRGNAVSIEAGATVINGTASGTSKVNSLTLAGGTGAWTSKLDITDNALIVQSVDAPSKAAAIPTLVDQIKSGKNTGTWDGQGITSSSIVGHSNATMALVDNADLNLGTYGGQSTDANSVIITRAIIGDADLSGVVDLGDFNRWFSHVGSSTYSYAAGDFDMSGIVDLGDFNAWFSHVGVSSLGLSSQPAAGLSIGGASAVPEPASLAVLALGGAALLGRRRRRN